jgi:hypothetical protein
VAVTPNSVDGTGQAQCEAWYLPVVGGSVLWSLDGYPGGTATIEVGSDMSRWQAGPAPDPAYAAQPAQPTRKHGIPWAVLPFGTIISVYLGWKDPVGNTDGVRVFDGIVTESQRTHSAATWVLTCADFSQMLDRTSWRHDLTLRELVVNAGGPRNDDLAAPTARADEFALTTAVRAMLREAGEFWWPNENSQLAHGQTAHYDLVTSQLPSDTMVKPATVVGARTAWSWVEEWADANGVECHMVPGARGRIRLAPPASVGAPTTTVRIGVGGTVIDHASHWRPVTNRLYLSLHGPAHQPPKVWTGTGGYDSVPGGHTTLTLRIQVRYSGQSVELEVTDYATQTGGKLDVDKLTFDWADPVETVNVAAGDRQETKIETVAGTKAPASIRHDYDAPGTYAVTVTGAAVSGALNFGMTMTIPITIYPGGEISTHGFWNNFALPDPSSVRRSGRIAWIGDRAMSRKRMRKAPPSQAQADARAAAMARRITGQVRSMTLSTVPMPWIMPRDTIALAVGDGIPDENHMVTAISLPLRVGEPATIETVTDNIGSLTRGIPITTMPRTPAGVRHTPHMVGNPMHPDLTPEPLGAAPIIWDPGPWGGNFMDQVVYLEVNGAVFTGAPLVDENGHPLTGGHLPEPGVAAAQHYVRFDVPPGGWPFPAGTHLQIRRGFFAADPAHDDPLGRYYQV